MHRKRSWKGRSSSYHDGCGVALFFGGGSGLGGLLFRSPLFNNTIVFGGAFDAIANLFTSWIVSHRGEMMRSSVENGKERHLLV